MATEGGKTLGDLIVVVREALNGPDDPNLRGAGFVFDELQRGAEAGWHKMMGWPLDEIGVLGLAQLLAQEIKYAARTGADESYVDAIQRGHALLRLLHAKATEMGVNVPLDQVDIPLTPVESI